MSVLWQSRDAAAATGGNNTGDWSATGVSIDTRTLGPGDLFVALHDLRDGHEFVAQALAKGAAAALVSRIPEGLENSLQLLLVDDVLTALGDLGRAARARSHARVLAITGSVGKTSTKEMLRAILTPQGRTHLSEASYNNQWGVPLTLARMPQDTEFAVIEIGMNHPGEIEPLVRMTRPDVALITNVAAVHMEAFVDLDAIAREKAALFSGAEAGIVAVINADLQVSKILMDAARVAGADIVTFGADESADFRLEDLSQTGESTQIQAQIRTPQGPQELWFKLSAPGRHLVMNALAALAGARALGADLAVAACDLVNWSPPDGRGARQTITLDGVEDHLTLTLIDDAFNASPISLAAAIDVLANSPMAEGDKGRKIAVLGDMLELGGREQDLHRDIAGLAGLDKVDVVHCVGPLMRHCYDELSPLKQGEWVETAPEMAARAHRLLRPGDLVLVKGSKGSKVSLVVDAIKKLGHSLIPKQ